jgi:hypothetical protein
MLDRASQPDCADGSMSETTESTASCAPRTRRAFRAGVAAVFGLGVAALAAHASAQGSASNASEPLRVDYRREGACPDGDAFFGAVRARTEKARPATSGEAARTLKVTVAEEARGSRGTLAIVAADGASSTSVREVRAATCDDVVSALALVAALAIDPEARTTPVALAPAPAPSASSAPPSDAGAPDAAPPSSASTAPSASSPPSAPAPPSPPPTPRSTPPESPPGKPISLGFEVGLGAEGSTVLATRPAFSVLVGLDLARDSLFSPAFTLRASRSLAGTAATSAGSASFVFSSVALEPCPLRVRLTEGVALLPCARIAVGYVDAAGSGITTPANATRLWGDVGAHARLNLAIGRFLSLDLHGGARVPLSRDRYYVEPDATVYEIPAVTFAFGGDVRLRF